jgi:alpha-D-ribose 1-methylphosphonate 5-triphosphate synthase subunit PhnG
MCQFSDSTQAITGTERQRWISVLARAPTQLLEAALNDVSHGNVQWLRPPETGLMMVQARIGGDGERFNFGEVTVTRCVLRIGQSHEADSCVGVSYVMGRSARRAELAARADALLQNPVHHATLAQRLLKPAQEHAAQVNAQRQTRAQSTKVEFFTVAREAGQPTPQPEHAR